MLHKQTVEDASLRHHWLRTHGARPFKGQEKGTRRRRRASSRPRSRRCSDIVLHAGPHPHLKDRQAGGGRSLPIALRVVAYVQGLVRWQVKKLQRAPENFRIGFVRADLARKDENAAEIFWMRDRAAE